MYDAQSPEALDRAGLCNLLLRAVQHVTGCAQTRESEAHPGLLHLIGARAAEAPKLRALIITPTRELAVQISASLTEYGAHLGDLGHTTVFGGVNENAQRLELGRGVDILVSTPGRLLELLGCGQLSLDAVALFVLHEAKSILDMGLLPDVRRLVAALPADRQTAFFAAAMPPPVRALAQSMLRPPAPPCVDRPSSPCGGIEQRLFFVESRDKRRLLVHLLGGALRARPLVFSRTKSGANHIVDFLEQHEISAAALHGANSASARARMLDDFLGGFTDVLVATDIAARGVDFERVSHVINFDLPSAPETFVHRLGRTTRPQTSGIVLSFCDKNELGCLAGIEGHLGARIDRAHSHPFALTPAPSHAEILRSRPWNIPSARGQKPASAYSRSRR